MTTPDHNLFLLETELRGLTDVSQVIHSVQDCDALMLFATKAITELLETEGSNIALTDPETGDLVFFLGIGEKYSKLKSFHLAEGEGVTGYCVRTASSVIVNDTHGDPRFSPRADAESGFTTRSILCVPLIVNGKCIGALSVVNKKRSTGFDERDRVYCEAIASQ